MAKEEDELSLQELRARIVKAASRLYESKGRETTVEEIAREAGISVPVTYQFVKKPADIMLLIMEDWQKDFMERVRPVLDDASLGPEQRLIQAVTHYYQVVDEQRSKVMLLYRASRRLDEKGRRRIMSLEVESVEVFRDILDAGVSAGAFRVADSLLAAYDIVMLGHMWSLKAWHFRRRAMDVQDFIDAQLAVILPMVKG
jgi:AcrR family transcriptional regulator